MTENEFLHQVWRAQDKVVLTNGETKRVLDISFRTRSINVAIEKGVREWLGCDCIQEHISYTKEPDDMAIIDDLRNKLIVSDKRIQNLQTIITEQRIKLESLGGGELKKCVNTLTNDLVMKKKLLERIENCCVRIDNFVENRMIGASRLEAVDIDPSKDIVEEERELMVKALFQYQNEADAANSMGMSVDRFRHRILKYGIKKTEWKGE